MRHFLMLLMLLGSTAVMAVDLQTGLNGSWWNPEQDGQGFVIHVIPEANQLFVAWFTFETDGGGQMWISGSGDLSQQPVSLDLLRPRGGALAAQDPEPELAPWGSGSLLFTSCTTAIFSYSGVDDVPAGEIEIQRLTPALGCEEG